MDDVGKESLMVRERGIPLFLTECEAGSCKLGIYYLVSLVVPLCTYMTIQNVHVN